LLFCVAFFNTKPISNQMVRDLGLSLTKHLVC
jgi:hypothetical protein